MLLMLRRGTPVVLGRTVVVAVVIRTDRSDGVVRSPASVIVTGGLVIPDTVCIDVPAPCCAAGHHEGENNSRSAE